MIRFSMLCPGLLTLALLAGCTAFKEVPAAEKHEIGGVFRVEPASAWSAQTTERGEIWTLNGFGLERMTFITNVEDGKSLLPQSQDPDAPVFRAHMNATDVVNLYEARLTSNGYSQIAVSNLRPHTVSGADAFRFDYTAYSSTGLAKRGTVVGLIDPEKGLNLAIYEAASEHYYEASRAAAEDVFASLEKI